MNHQAALSTMHDVVALWYVGQRSAADIVRTACDLLVAGLDGPALRMLAAVSIRHADEEVPDLLEPALRDLDLPYYPKSSPPAQEAGLKAMASRVLTGTLAPRELAAWVHRTFGHDTLELAERFAELDDSYDTLDYIDQTHEELDSEVRTEAHRILGPDHSPTAP